MEEERADLLAKRKEGITVEELPAREPETAPPTDSSKEATEEESHLDLDDPEMQTQLHRHISTCDEIPDLWASIPCTSGSPWQRVNCMKGVLKFMKRHAQQVKESMRLFSEFAKNAELAFACQGTVTFEWPKGCESWQRPDVKQFFEHHPEFMPVEFDGCAVGVQSTKGRPIKKRWRLMTTSKAIV